MKWGDKFFANVAWRAERAEMEIGGGYFPFIAIGALQPEEKAFTDCWSNIAENWIGIYGREICRLWLRTGARSRSSRRW